MTITEQIIHLSEIEFWLFFLAAVAGAGYAFFYAFRQIALARLIEDTPTTAVAFAQQGYVELSGIANPMDDTPLLAPLTGNECCWFSYKIEKRGNKSWRTVEQRSSSQVFLLTDDTGVCRIQPEGAQVTVQERNIWYGNSRVPLTAQLPGSQPKVKTLGGFLTLEVSVSGRYRYTEERIISGSRLYVIGNFKTADELDHHTQRNNTTREILRTWKQDRRALLARFDRDWDGEIDAEEWEQARQAARAEGELACQVIQSRSIAHSLSSGSNSKQPFLISTLPQFDLVKRLKLLAAGSITAFFVAGGLGVWMIGTRLAG